MNFQNFPKHKNKEVRSYIVAPKGYKLVAIDSGQIEARVIAMYTKDEAWCEAIRTNYDIHRDWALKIIDMQPSVVGIKKMSELTEAMIKDFRSKTKTNMVFPFFFGSSKHSVQRDLGLADKVRDKLHDEFWNTYGAVKEWQNALQKFYNKHGYVETLTGRRRHAPLSWNEMINAPVQSVAADIILDAMERLTYLAYKLDKPQYNPILQVHDDLPSYFPEESLEEDMRFIAKEMCRINFDFINVPLSAEVSVGDNWAFLEEVARYSTDSFSY